MLQTLSSLSDVYINLETDLNIVKISFWFDY